jgi:hypothetical protein
MRLCAALALVLVALVVLTVGAAQRPAKRAPAAADVDVDVADPPPTLAPTPRAFAAPRAGPRVEPREAGGIGHLRGRLFFPDDLRTSNLDVVAEDFTRRVTALLDDDDRFEVHLPPGRYTLIAWQDDLVGVVPDVVVRAGATRDVDIHLAAGAAIRGTVYPPDADVVISAASSGSDSDWGSANVEDGAFSIEGLLPGHRYDLTVTGRNVRKQTINGVMAPADGVEVVAEPPIKVRGAFAMTDDMFCPFANVELQVAGATALDEDGDEITTDVDDDCGFSLTGPGPGAQLTLVATGGGWYVEHPIVIPARGDPAFVRIDL